MMTKMVEVTQDDANNYCRVLTALGIEDGGDPVEEIERLRAELAEAVTALPQAVRNERERCAELCYTHRRSWPMDGPATADTIQAAIRRA